LGSVTKVGENGEEGEGNTLLEKNLLPFGGSLCKRERERDPKKHSDWPPAKGQETRYFVDPERG